MDSLGAYCVILNHFKVICSPAKVPAEVAQVLARLSQKDKKTERVGIPDPPRCFQSWHLLSRSVLTALAAGSRSVVVVMRG